MFWLGNKKNNFQLDTFIWRSDRIFLYAIEKINMSLNENDVFVLFYSDYGYAYFFSDNEML